MSTETLQKAAVGDRVTLNGEEYEVQTSCGKTGRGRWVCLTHEQAFDTAFAKDGHIHDGTHIMAWYCQECGRLEVP